MLLSLLYTSPDDSSTRAAVEAKLHESSQQTDGQKVSTLRVVGVEQRAVRTGGSEGDFKLHE